MVYIQPKYSGQIKMFCRREYKTINSSKITSFQANVVMLTWHQQAGILHKWTANRNSVSKKCCSLKMWPVTCLTLLCAAPCSYVACMLGTQHLSCTSWALWKCLHRGRHVQGLMWTITQGSDSCCWYEVLSTVITAYHREGKLKCLIFGRNIVKLIFKSHIATKPK